jgi:hypothetical protein
LPDNFAGRPPHRTPSYANFLCFAGLAFALAYFVFELWAFKEGQRGDLRGAVGFLAGSIFATALLVPGSRIARGAILAALLVSAMGAVDLVLHSPGSSLLGLNPRNLGDFAVHTGAAAEIFREGISPYGPDISNFPFPTYAILWASSGFGRWGADWNGFVFTLLNLAAAFVTIVVSLRLAQTGPATPTPPERAWVPLAVMLFLILNTQAWPNVMMGQTPLLAACFILLGLWLSQRRTSRHEILSGFFLALGIMTKPNFLPFLLYFAGAWVKDAFRTPGLRDRHHHARILSYCVLPFISIVVISIVLPGGISLATYTAFGGHIAPALEYLQGPRNISLVAVLDTVFPTLHRKLASALLIAASAGLVFAVERYRQRSLLWPVWLVVPLLVSPVTWSIYTVLLLPAQLVMARQAGSRAGMLSSILLVMSAGMLYIMKTYVGAAGLMLTLYLALGLHFTRASSASEVTSSSKPTAQMLPSVAHVQAGFH